jgi:hypothetical protein
MAGTSRQLIAFLRGQTFSDAFSHMNHTSGESSKTPFDTSGKKKLAVLLFRDGNHKE